MIIIGAGLAGLIAANVLSRHKPQILEAKPTLPNNHTAVLRFKSSIIGDVLGIHFKKVNMIKATVPWRNPVADALAYSFKNTGMYLSDRSITQSQLVSETRCIAPPDLIQRLASNAAISFNHNLDRASYHTMKPGLIISTIPMPTLMDILEYPKRDELNFPSTAGINIHATIPNCDAYVSLLVVHPESNFSRISITGDSLIVEGNEKLKPSFDNLQVVASLLGLDPKQFENVSSHPQRYAKISPIDEDKRRRFMAWATDKHNIYSLGRFATWRPQLQLDDLINDIRLIERWSSRDDRYDMHHKR